MREFKTIYRREATIEDAQKTRERVDTSLKAPQKLATLHFDAKWLEAGSLLDMEAAPEVLSKRASALDLRIITRSPYQSDVGVNIDVDGLTISVDQAASWQADAMFAVLHRWAISNAATPFARLWLSGYQIWMALLALACLFTFVLGAHSSLDTLREKGRALVATGVSLENCDETLRLLLAIASNDQNEPPAVTWSGRSVTVLAVLVVMSLPLLKFGGGSDEILRDLHH